MAHFSEAHHALAHEVDEPSRRGDKNFRAAGQGLGLGPDGGAPKHAKAAGFVAGGEAADFGLDLRGQLPGRGENERPGAAGAGPARIGELFNEGKGESRRLSRAGLGNAQHILTR